MRTWNIKTNEAFQKEWKDYKDDHSTEGYNLKYVFEIYLPFWECKQNVVVEKDLELDIFSKILLEFISYKKPSYTDICQFLGIKENDFCIIQLNFLINKMMVRERANNSAESYEITHEGIEFLKKKKMPKTMETEEFNYMVKEKYSFLENDMTNDFFDPLKPIDKQLSSGKKNDFSGYKILQTHKIRENIKDLIHIKHDNNPTYKKIEMKRNDFAEFYNTMNPNKIFYDFANNTFERHQRSICFLGFWYESEENPSDRKVDIRQFEKSVENFSDNEIERELERELSKKVTEHVLKNDIRIGASPEEITAKTIEQNELQNSTNPVLSVKNDNIKDKFIEAAKQSKTDSDGYILMNEYALTLKSLGVEWDKNKGFRKFLESYKNIIEFKPNAPSHAPVIKIIYETPEQKLIEEADKIYIDTCALMETPIEKFFEKINPILKKYRKKIIIPLTVELELKKIAKNKKYEPEKRIKAEKVLELLYPDINEIEIIGEECDNEKIADQVFKILFEKYRTKYKMLLISQDAKLSGEILNMNNSEAVHGKKCVACRIDDDGYLCKI